MNENDDKKQMPHAGDLIPKLNKLILERKNNKQKHWLQLAKMQRQEKLEREKAA